MPVEISEWSVISASSTREEVTLNIKNSEKKLAWKLQKKKKKKTIEKKVDSEHFAKESGDYFKHTVFVVAYYYNIIFALYPVYGSIIVVFLCQDNKLPYLNGSAITAIADWMSTRHIYELCKFYNADPLQTLGEQTYGPHDEAEVSAHFSFIMRLTQRGKNGVEIKLMYMQVCRVQPHLLSFKYTHCSTWSTFKEDAVHLPPILITLVEYRMRRIDHYLLKFCVPKKGLLSMHAAFRSTSLRTHEVTRTHICELPCTSASAAQLSSFGVNTSLKVSTV